MSKSFNMKVLNKLLNKQKLTNKTCKTTNKNQMKYQILLVKFKSAKQKFINNLQLKIFKLEDNKKCCKNFSKQMKNINHV